MNLWIPKEVPLYIDDYQNLPQGNILSFDIETNSREIDDALFDFVCIGLSDGQRCWVYFDVRPDLINLLNRIGWVTQDGIHAELPWMRKKYPQYNWTPEHIYADTKIMGYVHDSTKKNYALKPMVEEYLGVQYPTYSEIVGNRDYIKQACERRPELLTQKKKGAVLPKKVTLVEVGQEITAQYNAADTYWTWKLMEYFRKYETTGKRSFMDNIELPTNRLISRMETKGIKIDTKEIVRLHKQHKKQMIVAEKLFKKLAGIK